MQIASLFKEPEFGEVKPALKVMLDNPSVKEVRISMLNGQVMKEHKAPYPIVVYVAEGIIDFAVSGQMHHLERGDMIAVEAGVLHELTALADSVIRLSLHKFAKPEN